VNINLIQQTTDLQSSFGMSGYHHTFAPCTDAARFAVRTIDLAQGEVGRTPATATLKGWVRGTSAWSPPIV
jgi:hypothetical protein